MSSTIVYGEYEVLLPCKDVNAAFTFSRELFSREYVVQRITYKTLGQIVKENETHWKGLATIHPGHVVISVDGVRVRGFSSRQFAALWSPPEALEKETQKMAPTSRRVRFCDRKRAEYAVEMQKEWIKSGPMRYQSVQDAAAIQKMLDKAHGCIWDHQLPQAHAILRSLPVHRDPMIALVALEMEVVRVLVSKDALYTKQAHRVASQTVRWFETLSTLSSLSYSSRKQMQLLLAEALFLLALLHLVSEHRLTAIVTARRSAAIYVKLDEKFCHNSTKIDQLLMPFHQLERFQNRIRFGMGVLYVGGALARQSSMMDWVSVLLKGEWKMKTGVEYLLDVAATMTNEAVPLLQANWAALILLHSSGAIRLVQQREHGVNEQLDRALCSCMEAALERHPKALLFLWGVATTSKMDTESFHHRLEVEVARVLADKERVHLVQFDIGYRYFLARKFDISSTFLTATCKSSSAPSKVRGLSSLFLAAIYLLTSPIEAKEDLKLLNSVRLLLRSARRFLTLRLEENKEDVEAGALQERVRTYLEQNDTYLSLLPWELFYVYPHSSKRTKLHSTISNADHGAALQELDRLATAVKSITNHLHYDVELTLLRAIVLFHLHQLDACEQTLQNLWSVLSPNERRSRCSPAPFVGPVAWFYHLQVLFERRCSGSTLSFLDRSGPLFSNAPESTQPLSYPYAYIYNGKIQTLSNVLTRFKTRATFD